MTTYLADFAWSKPSVAALKGAGYSGVCRYLSRDTSGKNLSRAEADAYRTAGIAIVSNWEYDPQAALNGYNQGVADATLARTQHEQCGGPATAPIYFSVDFDTTPGQQAAINAYLNGCASVLGKSRVGVYGSYYVVERCAGAGTASWFWQTYAWSGGQWSSHAHIRQIQNGITVGGADCDRNQAMTANYGQWGAAAPSGGFLMALTDAQQLEVLTILQKMGAADGSYAITQHIDAATTAANKAAKAVSDLAQMVSALRSEVDEIKAAQSTPAPVQVDASAVATQVTNSTVEAVRGLTFKAV
jgi:hypothetical protein